jgi:ABC-2 type transport system ATP-binding protein
MKQRLGIAQALLHKPELIILDEPTSGLDPQGMKDVRELIRELGRQGTTVFLSSHLLHEIEQICNRAVIIDRGKVVVQGPVAMLRPKQMGVKFVTSDQQATLRVLSTMLEGHEVEHDEEYVVARADGDAVPEMVRRLVAEGIDVRAVLPAVEQGLEDFFLELTTSSDRGSAKPVGAPATTGRPETPGTPAGDGRAGS